MQSNDARSDTNVDESEHRAVGRNEVLPNFVHRRTHETRTERDEQDITQSAGDNTVSVVRDGDEYLVIGSDAENAETDSIGIDREPAIRHAVVQGEQLWRIPNNWKQYLRVRNDDAPDQILYRIPDPSVCVVVRAPQQDDINDTRYLVEKVGSVETPLVETPDREAHRDLISKIEEQDDASEAVLKQLRNIEDQWVDFDRTYKQYMKKWGDEEVWGLFQTKDERVVESWSFDPWEADQDITEFVPAHHKIDTDVLSRVAARLVNAGVVSPSPAFEVRIKDGEMLPPGYFVQALAESGCSPAEIVDWIMVKTRGHTPSTWSDVRDEHEPEIKKNVSAADKTLTS